MFGVEEVGDKTYGFMGRPCDSAGKVLPDLVRVAENLGEEGLV